MVNGRLTNRDEVELLHEVGGNHALRCTGVPQCSGRDEEREYRRRRQGLVGRADFDVTDDAVESSGSPLP